MGRLLLAIAAISCSGCLSLEFWPAHVLMMASLWAAAVIQGARLDFMLRRLLLFLPLVLAVAVGVPATASAGTGWNWTLTIVLRALVAFFAGVWLVQVLPFQELRGVLAGLRVPAVFLESLSFMHRYSVVLWEELARLKTARSARIGPRSGLRTWTISAQLIGELLLRAWDRAERVHRAMRARSGDASFPAGSSR